MRSELIDRDTLLTKYLQKLQDITNKRYGNDEASIEKEYQ